MPNWWLIWAEHLARVLAAWWLRSRPPGTGESRPGPDHPASPPGDPPHPPAEGG